jgi:hypothetical protein
VKRERRYRCIAQIDTKPDERLRFCFIPGNKLIIVRRMGNPLLVNTKTGVVTELHADSYFS